MRYKIIVLLSALLALSIIKINAQEVKSGISIERDTIYLGDQIKMLLSIDYPEGLEVEIPVPGDTITSFIEIISRNAPDTIDGEDDRQKIVQEYVITAFDSGAHVIPPFWFKINYNLLSDSIKTKPVTLNVTTPVVDLEKGLVDIKSVEKAPISIKEIAPWILGALLAGSIIFLLLYSIKRRKNNKPIFAAPPKPKEPAHIIAFRDLDAIKEEKIWQKGEIKKYYSRLTDVLRNYIEDRYEIPAMEQTTDEIVQAFKYRSNLIDDKLFSKLQTILREADLAKFAKHQPLSDDNDRALNESYLFVEQTKKIIKAAPEKPVDDYEGEEVTNK